MRRLDSNYYREFTDMPNAKKKSKTPKKRMSAADRKRKKTAALNKGNAEETLSVLNSPMKSLIRNAYLTRGR
jgi:hypothetical protein